MVEHPSVHVKEGKGAKYGCMWSAYGLLDYVFWVPRLGSNVAADLLSFEETPRRGGDLNSPAAPAPGTRVDSIREPRATRPPVGRGSPSLGIAVEDLASGRYVYRKALKTGRGTVMEL